MTTTTTKTTTTAAEVVDRRAMARSATPIPCYNVGGLPPKWGGEGLYAALGTAVENGKATLIRELTIRPCDARTWTVPAGHLWRIVCTDGPQVADMNCWALPLERRERFYASKTRQIHATHLTTGDRLWSNMPYMRPLATIVHDTIQYGFDEDGAGVHDVIGSRCDPYTHHLMTNSNSDTCCHSNLTRAVFRYADGDEDDDDDEDDEKKKDHGKDHYEFNEWDVHDVLNVFMCTGFTRATHQYFTKPSPVEVGDYLEFLAETDLLVAASTCPQGDVSWACGSDENDDDDDDNKKPAAVYPLGVQIWKPDEGWLEKAGWKPSECSGYSGNHGLPSHINTLERRKRQQPPTSHLPPPNKWTG